MTKNFATAELGVEMQPTETDLSFPRAKRRSIPIGLAFRLRPVLVRLLGRRRVLLMLLQASRVSWRLAFETATEYYGERFMTDVYALPGKRLADWVPEGARVIDIGCGSGRVARLVADRAEAVIGVDRNADHIRLATQYANPPNVSFKLGDADQELDGEYDLALVIHLLEHLDDPDAFLTRLRSVARRVIIEVPDFRADGLNIARLDLGADFSTDADHVREYTPAVLAEQLARNGWTISDWSEGYTSFAALAVAS
jgi:SAM-dependent methyltransferase